MQLPALQDARGPILPVAGHEAEPVAAAVPAGLERGPQGLENCEALPLEFEL